MASRLGQVVQSLCTCHLKSLAALQWLLQGVERVGARQSPPPPPVIPTVMSTLVADSHGGKEGAEMQASSIAAKVNALKISGDHILYNVCGALWLVSVEPLCV